LAHRRRGVFSHDIAEFAASPRLLPIALVCHHPLPDPGPSSSVNLSAVRNQTSRPAGLTLELHGGYLAGFSPIASSVQRPNAI